MLKVFGAVGLTVLWIAVVPLVWLFSEDEVGSQAAWFKEFWAEILAEHGPASGLKM